VVQIPDVSRESVSHEPSPQAEQYAAAKHLQYQTGILHALGAMAQNQMVKDLDESNKLLNALLSNDISAQDAYHILRASTSAKLDFLMRTTNPMMMDNVIRGLNSRLINIFSQKLKLDQTVFSSNSLPYFQLLSPIRAGGLALCRHLYVARIAYLSSMAHLSARLTSNATDMELFRNSSLRNANLISFIHLNYHKFSKHILSFLH
jgi:hypothetical protein